MISHYRDAGRQACLDGDHVTHAGDRHRLRSPEVGDLSSKKRATLHDGVRHARNASVESVPDLAYGLIEHSGEHYGQLVAYCRVAGMVPPESRPQK